MVIDPQDWMINLTRWLHLIAGISWVGTSLYFNWLDGRVRPSSSTIDSDVDSVYTIHGGSFYYKERYSPTSLPDRLLAHGWEARTTWLSGIAMLVMVYWWSASTYLIDPEVADISPLLGVLVSAASITVAWLFYHTLCKQIGNNRTVLIVMIIVLSLAAFAYQQIFSGRAAYIHMGAMMGTIMAMNVVFVIVPGHREMVGQLRAGEELDKTPGLAAKRRSRHNNYFTLPVLFSMVSGHFPSTYGHQYAWLILVLIMLGAVAWRHYFNLRHDDRNVAWLPLGGSALIAAAMGISALTPSSSAESPESVGGSVSEVHISSLIWQRCASCHSSKPTQPGFATAPAGLMFDSYSQIVQNRARIENQVLLTRVMPPSNMTGMTEEERELLGRWLKSLEQ